RSTQEGDGSTDCRLPPGNWWSLSRRGWWSLGPRPDCPRRDRLGSNPPRPRGQSSRPTDHFRGWQTGVVQPRARHDDLQGRGWLGDGGLAPDTAPSGLTTHGRTNG